MIDLRGRRVVLDPGHSEGRPGARGGPPDYVDEHELNELQAGWIQQRLESWGAQVEIPDPDEDDLALIGASAARADAFVSLHHNALDRIDHHTFACVHRRHASPGSIALAAEVAPRVGRAIGLPLRQQGDLPPGVVRQGLSVLRAAELAGCPGAILIESYFVDAYGDARHCRVRSLTAADAIADGLAAWLARS